MGKTLKPWHFLAFSDVELWNVIPKFHTEKFAYRHQPVWAGRRNLIANWVERQLEDDEREYEIKE